MIKGKNYCVNKIYSRHTITTTSGVVCLAAARDYHFFPNPVEYTGPDGKSPGDVFPTIDDAASDFGKSFGGASINDKIEYGTTIIPKDGDYTYMEPTTGTIDSIVLPTPSNGPDEAVAGAHTHSNYDPKYDSNEFSDKDKDTARQFGKPFYVSTPNGTLKVFYPVSGERAVLDKKVPHRVGTKSYNYTLVSTTAIGATIFWKYTSEYKYAQGLPATREYP